jgi:hypothetical protein
MKYVGPKRRFLSKACDEMQRKMFRVMLLKEFIWKLGMKYVGLKRRFL